MKLAFLILAHKLPAQLDTLIRLLQGPDVGIFLHVDAKSTAIDSGHLARWSALPGVTVLDKPESVSWGSFAQIRATWRLLETAHARGPYDRYLLVSGQDLPLMPPDAMRAFFLQHPDAQFMECFALPAPARWNGEGGMDRVELLWLDPPLEPLNRPLHAVQRTFGFRRRLDGGPFFGGANWFNLNAPCVAWLIAWTQANPQFWRMFQHTRCADEMVVQTLVMRSPFASTCVAETLRHINWEDGPEFPRTLRSVDLPRILADQRALFARKFDPAVDAEVGRVVVNAAWLRYGVIPEATAQSLERGTTS